MTRDSSPEHWKKVQELLDELMDLDTAECNARLKKIGADDDELRSDVESLLEADSRAPGFLDANAVEFAAPALTDDQAVEMDERIGLYHLSERIGRGGSSDVFRAVRDDGHLKQQVAIKVLRHHGPGSELERRFKVERQILTTLTHPAIAVIHDGGVTERGWPYLVMEYVEGSPLTTYCGERELSTTKKLELFEQVCSAVHYAHQRLVVHRDLKPSNVLVTNDGMVKLLDFGIAKVLDWAALDMPATMPVTLTGMQLMTPEYASPEQVQGREITTASDVYSLGVMLYEVLTEKRPFDLAGKSPVEIERIVCEQEPPSPNIGNEDLATICLKALRKSPDRRYASVREFGDDLERYRNGLPVMAQPATTSYRVRKFLRRNWLPASAIGSLMILILGFAVAMTLQQAATARERDRAELEAAKSAEVTDFVLGLFESTDPNLTQGADITASELLANGVSRANAITGQPALRAQMLVTMGEAYARLGFYDDAEPLLREAVELRREGLGGDNVEVGSALSALGGVVKSQGLFTEAETIHREALAVFRGSLTERDPLIGVSLKNIGGCLEELGKYAEAESLLTVSAQIMAETLSESDPLVLATLSGLAKVLTQRGDTEGALETQTDILSRRRVAHGDMHLNVAESLVSLGLLNRRLGQFAEAEQHYVEALAIREQLLEPGHPEIAGLLGNLGVLMGIQAKWDESESYFVLALDKQRTAHGNEHPAVATALNNLSVLMLRTGRPEDALQYQEQSLAIRRVVLGENHPLVAADLDNLASILADLGRLDEAEELSTRALAIQEVVFGSEHREVALTLGNLGYYKYLRGDFAGAAKVHRESLDMRRSVLGAKHPDVATALRSLGMALRDGGKFEEAEPVLRESLAMRLELLGPDHPRTAESQELLGVLLTRKGVYEEAEVLLLACLKTRIARFSPDHGSVIGTRDLIVDLYEQSGRQEMAARYRN